MFMSFDIISKKSLLWYAWHKQATFVGRKTTFNLPYNAVFTVLLTCGTIFTKVSLVSFCLFSIVQVQEIHQDRPSLDPKCNVLFVNIKPIVNQELLLLHLNSLHWRENSVRSSIYRSQKGQNSQRHWIWLKHKLKSGFKTGEQKQSVSKKPNLKNWKWQQSPCYRQHLVCHFPPPQQRITQLDWVRYIDLKFPVYYSPFILRRTLTSLPRNQQPT